MKLGKKIPHILLLASLVWVHYLVLSIRLNRKTTIALFDLKSQGVLNEHQVNGVLRLFNSIADTALNVGILLSAICILIALSRNEYSRLQRGSLLFISFLFNNAIHMLSHY